MTDAIHLHAAGKLNLHLRVLSRRADGFHEIASWAQAVDWGDALVVRAVPRAGVVIRCGHADVPLGADNLVHRAWAALRVRTGAAGGIEVDLEKRLPIGGGMGGGSADAAATLIALARLWGLAPDSPAIRETAEALGSDVPFFLGRGAAVMTGRGTQIAPHPRPFDGWATLVLPPFGLATAAVYAACTPHPAGADEQPPWDLPWSGAAELSARLRNDLEPAAMRVEPRLAEVQESVRRVTQEEPHVSGAGSTLFVLADTQELADARAERIRQQSGVPARAVRVHAGAACRVVAPPG